MYTFIGGHTGEVFDYLVTHGRMKEKEARAKFRQVSVLVILMNLLIFITQYLCWVIPNPYFEEYSEIFGYVFCKVSRHAGDGSACVLYGHRKDLTLLVLSASFFLE